MHYQSDLSQIDLEIQQTQARNDLKSHKSFTEKDKDLKTHLQQYNTNIISNKEKNIHVIGRPIVKEGLIGGPNPRNSDHLIKPSLHLRGKDITLSPHPLLILHPTCTP